MPHSFKSLSQLIESIGLEAANYNLFDIIGKLHSETECRTEQHRLLALHDALLACNRYANFLRDAVHYGDKMASE